MKETNKKGFTIVELIVSFVLVMIVIIYLLKTIVVAVNKNNDLLTIQDLSVYEKNFLSELYKDIDSVYYSDTYDGMTANGNTITLEDVDKNLVFDENNNKITYADKIYQLPSGISFRKVNNKVYNLTEKGNNPYQVLTIYLKVDSTNENKDMKILYQNMKMEEKVAEEEDVIVTFESNGGTNPEHQIIPYKKNQYLSTRNVKKPKLDQHILKEWNTKQDGTGSKVNLATTKANDGDVYYAKWVSSLNDFIYDFNEGNNMNKWNKQYSDRFSVTYDSNSRMNTISVNGASGWENLYIPIETVTGKAYKIKFDYKNTSSYTTLSGYDGIGAQVLYNTPTNTNNIGLSLNTVYLSPTANSNTQTIEIQFTADSSKSYLNFNFGMAADNTTTTVQLGNIQLIEQVEIGDTISSLPVLYYYGYTHNGWYDERVNGTKINNTITVEEDLLTIYEKNVANQYIIAYNLDGGSYGVSHPGSAYFDQSITINNPTKSVTAKFVRGTNASDAVISSTADITKSYTFNGWSISDMDSGLHYYGNSTSSNTSLSGIKDTTFKNLRGDTGTTNFSATWAAPTITLPKVTKTGYTCKWTSDSMEWNSEGSYKPADVAGATTRTFTAVCTPIKVKVTFKNNGGTGNDATQTFTYGVSNQYFTNKNYSKVGHNQTGWSDSTNNVKQYSIDSGVSDGWILSHYPETTVYAAWSPKTVKVRFYGNGNTGGPKVSEQTFTYGVSNQSFSDKGISKTGNELLGWNHDASATTSQYAITSGVSNDWINSHAPYTEVHAVWSLRTITIKYSLSGNSGVPIDGNNWSKSDCQYKTYGSTTVETGATFSSSTNPYTCHDKTVKYGKHPKDFPKPTFNNYNFLGWYTSENCAGTRVYSHTVNTEISGSSLTLHACLKAKSSSSPDVEPTNTYKVVFNKNAKDATGTMSNQSFTYGTSQKLTKNSFSRTGYTFAGWATSSNGSVKYDDQDSVKNLTKTNNGTVNLYAKWKGNKYTVTYNPNGASGSPYSENVIYGNSYYIWYNWYSRDRYEFVGWNEKADGSGVWWEPDTYWSWIDTEYAKNINLYAIWKSVCTYQCSTISYDYIIADYGSQSASSCASSCGGSTAYPCHWSAYSYDTGLGHCYKTTRTSYQSCSCN